MTRCFTSALGTHQSFSPDAVTVVRQNGLEQLPQSAPYAGIVSVLVTDRLRKAPAKLDARR